jgi:hypothetical protein
MKGKPPMPQLVSPAADPADPTPVDVVFLNDDAVVTRAGRLLSHRGDRYEVTLETAPPAAVSAGGRVVLAIGGDTPRRVPARVVSLSDTRLVVEVRGASRTDKRRFPRLVGAIGLRWRPLQDDTEDAWHEPDPLMNFSVVGFSFGAGAEDTQEGALLGLDFQVPGTSSRFSAVARVVRVAARAPAEVHGDETHEVSVEMIEAPLEAREALADLTLRIQRAMTDTDR